MPRIKRSRTSSYTTVSNEFLMDKTLGLTERGLLMTMLSLPDNWEFSGRGLAAILPDGRDKVFSSLRKLEERGYLRRNRITLRGKVVDYEYEFCDCPIFPKKQAQAKEKRAKRTPVEHHPRTENPDTDIPNTENDDKNQYKKGSTVCLDVEIKGTDEVVDLYSNCTKGSTDEPRISSLPVFDHFEREAYSSEPAELFPSLVNAVLPDKARPCYVPEPTQAELSALKTKDEMLPFVKERIVMHDFCVKRLGLSPVDVDYIADVLTEMLLSRRLRFGGQYVGIRCVRARLSKLNAEKIACIICDISRNTKGVGNYRQYVKKALWIGAGQ